MKIIEQKDFKNWENRVLEEDYDLERKKFYKAIYAKNCEKCGQSLSKHRYRIDGIVFCKNCIK